MYIPLLPLLLLPFSANALSFSLTVSLTLTPSPLQLVERLPSPPAPWTLHRRAAPTDPITLSLAVDRTSHVTAALHAVSDPTHPRYRQHLTRAEAQALLSPDDATFDAITAWLGSNGDDVVIARDHHWIRVTTTVARANALLAADYAWFRHAGSGKEVLRTLAYSLPAELSRDVLLVSPTTRFCSHPDMHRGDGSSGGGVVASQTDMQGGGGGGPSADELRRVRRRATGLATGPDHLLFKSTAVERAAVDPSCNRTITPTCLRSLYNMPANLTVSKARGLGVYSSQNQVPKFKDFDIFIKNIDPASSTTNFTFLSINNATTDQNQKQFSNQELNFDVQYSAALSNPVPNVITAVTGDGPAKPEPGDPANITTEPWLIWLDAMLKLPDDQLPHTITTSFGENEQALPDGYAQQVCNTFGTLGARGVTIFAASGDSGPGNTCVSNDGTNATRFTPVFPGTCPFVTGVGGTRGVSPENALSFSSGGFSDKFARPTYQDAAVPGYVQKTVGNRFQGLFNASGRGFPDVSAQSFNITFADSGGIGGFAGTSAAAPIWAGIVGKVNAALIQQNKPPMGFINPWLYGQGLSTITDVTTGFSVGCTGKTGLAGQPFPPETLPKIVPDARWDAAPGWDAVTGLGTPDMGKMLAMLMAA